MAKLCLCVLAHKNVHQLSRLLRSLQHPDVNILIHFDSKMTEPADNGMLRAANPNVYVLPERNSNLLDDWSLVDTTLKLSDYAIGNQLVDPDNGYIGLISGQDYPIKPISALVEKLNKENGKEFIDCHPYEECAWMQGKLAHSMAYCDAYHSTLRNTPPHYAVSI